jgi:thymidylate synthase ThyX
LNPYKKLNLKQLNNQSLKEKIGNIISKYHDHHHQMGNVAQSGSILIDGITDYGVIKDLVRHRSFEKFIPILEENVNMDAELDRKVPYGMCDYLEIGEMETLKIEYSKRMDNYYKEVRRWYKDAKAELSEEISNEYVKYLLPHGHSTRYKFYASIDDLAYTIALRTRNGGHIAYRKLTYDWLKALAQKDPFWKGLLKKLPEVIIDSREQFIDRS